MPSYLWSFWVKGLIRKFWGLGFIGFGWVQIRVWGVLNRRLNATLTSDARAPQLQPRPFSGRGFTGWKVMTVPHTTQPMHSLRLIPINYERGPCHESQKPVVCFRFCSACLDGQNHGAHKKRLQEIAKLPKPGDSTGYNRPSSFRASEIEAAAGFLECKAYPNPPGAWGPRGPSTL